MTGGVSVRFETPDTTTIVYRCSRIGLVARVGDDVYAGICLREIALPRLPGLDRDLLQCLRLDWVAGKEVTQRSSKTAPIPRASA